MVLDPSERGVQPISFAGGKLISNHVNWEDVLFTVRV